MEVNITHPGGGVVVATLRGRLDARGAAEADPVLREVSTGPVAVLELSGVDYLSSAGVRIFVALHKNLHLSGRRLILAGLQPYCLEVLRISGLDHTLETTATIGDALALAAPAPKPFRAEAGTFTFRPGAPTRATVEILGDIRDVLDARITPEKVHRRKFSTRRFSIGLGGLGADTARVMPLMGEMMTVGGTMVWLPTDGSDTPDFLIPAADSDAVVIHTAFNASLGGDFNEFFEFEAADSRGATLSDIYRAIFDRARDIQPGCRGAVWLSLRAEMTTVFGSGIIRSPIAAHAPANGRPITDASNFPAWFECDESPRHTELTGLTCGMGLDLDHNLSGFDRKRLNSAFYLNPANTSSSREMLHNHGSFFSPQPLGNPPYKLENEIDRVVAHGDFIDMRHLFDRTAVAWALGGVTYVQDFLPDTAREVPPV